MYDAGEDLGAESVGDGAAPSICSKDDVTGNSWRRTRVVTGVFGTYTGHGFTYLDYADQRFYASSYGRFNTDDPYRASAGAAIRVPGTGIRMLEVTRQISLIEVV